MTDLTNEKITELFNEYAKLYQRIQRNGENVIYKKGRKKVSDEHKRQTYLKWIEIRKTERKEKALLEGRECKRGRPKKETKSTA